MRVCGIIAEYNPFHLGHAHHIAETRRRLGGDAAVVCVMSGNYVQRGDFALLEKYERAAMAAEGGADLVLELPLCAALSSAEGFARGGVSALAALGVVTHLSFGAECAELSLLRRAAGLRQSDALRPALAEGLRAGLSYPAAMQRAMEAIDPEAAALLETPNNTLGIAYCAALDELDSPIEPLAIPRAGAAHDSAHAEDGFASASMIRARVVSGEPWEPYLSPAAARRLRAALAAERAPMQAANCDAALLAQLRRLDAEALGRYAPSTDGFAERLERAIRTGRTFPEVCAASQTRRYPLARVRRALLRAYLDLPDALPVEPQYLRVLALGARGAEVLRSVETELPIIVKPAAERGLPDTLQPALRRDALADDLYALAAPSAVHRAAGERWRKTPFVLK